MSIPTPVDLVHGPDPKIIPMQTAQLYPRVRPNPSTVGPLITMIAVDAVGVIVEEKNKDWRKMIDRFLEFPYKVNIDVERSFMALKERYTLVLLADMLAKHVVTLHEKIMPQSFSYIVQCRTRDEYLLFCEAHRPQMLFSNLHRKFNCESMGASCYDGPDGLLRLIETYTRI